MTAASPKANFPALLQRFFLERLVQQRNVSPFTVAAYRDCFRLLLNFAQRHLGKAPEALALSDLDAPLMIAFLNYLECERHNTIRSRNARFAAVRAFLHFAAFYEPTALPVIQRVLAIPLKRFDRPLVGFLSRNEIQAILDAPDTTTWCGHRDRAMFMVFYNTGGRVSEITGLKVGDVVLNGCAQRDFMARDVRNVACHYGKPPLLKSTVGFRVPIYKPNRSCFLAGQVHA